MFFGKEGAGLRGSGVISVQRGAPSGLQLPPLRRRPLSPISCSRIPDRGDRWSGTLAPPLERTEERAVGEKGRSRWGPYHYKKKKGGVANTLAQNAERQRGGLAPSRDTA